MKYCLTLLSFLYLTTLSAQKEIKLPEEAGHFVLKNYSMEDYIEGDLNSDGKKDAILILKNNADKDSLPNGEVFDAFMILLRDANDKLTLGLRNDSLLMAHNHTAYYSGTEIKGSNGFSISFFGGRRFKWNLELTFKYYANDKDWQLVLEKNEGFDSGKMKKDETLIIKEEELKGITASNYKHFQDDDSKIRWKVIAEKTFFYTNPDKHSKPRKGYLVKGNILEHYRVTTNFVQGGYNTTSGFILKKDLQKIDEH